MRRRGRSALERAVGLLARRERSRHELRARLLREGGLAAEVDAALERLGEAGLQDDARFADSLIRHRVAAGYGPRYIAQELLTHRLSPELITERLGAAEVDWQAVARALLQRRFPAGWQEPAEARRALGLLQRRGFDAEVQQAVLAT
ncbi:MAG: hypothetical protein KatS3mg126_1384 [Lysobacteraceae bacterium]|nr:MAG: hypothetical protein KatS3mg126_1384 [Xanthomonadaceae bacterium]